jgi:hypothetical protein
LKDYYALLGLPRGASDREIKRAHKKLVRKWHPDLHLDLACILAGLSVFSLAPTIYGTCMELPIMDVSKITLEPAYQSLDA